MRAWKWFAGGVIAAGLAWGCASTKGKDQATQGDVRAPRSSADAQLASAQPQIATTVTATSSGWDLDLRQVGLGFGIGVLLAIGFSLAVRFTRVHRLAH